jgi:alpha-beta hydrolase superfamily lysophospholipase
MILRKKIRFPIRPAGLPAESWEMVGWLSVPPNFTSGTILILTPGACYRHYYWDSPYQPEVYSFVQFAYQRGIATLNLDRLGSGESSHPPGKILRMERHAEALAQIVGCIRARAIEDHTFSRCVLVGHSLGALASALSQAIYKSADAVVLSGIAGANVTNIDDSEESNQATHIFLRPAREEPLLNDYTDRYDSDYFAMRANWRPRMNFYVPSTDPRIIEMDEVQQGTMTTGEIETKGTAADSAIRLTVPVLVLLGQFDALFHNPELEADMSNAYAQAIARAPANFTVAPLIKNAGHNLAQHPNAHESFAILADWLQRIGV